MTYYSVFHPSTPSCDCYADYYSDLQDALSELQRYKGKSGVVLRIHEGDISDLNEEPVYSEYCG